MAVSPDGPRPYYWARPPEWENVTGPASDIIGRVRELDSLHAFLESAAREPKVMVLEGQAGIGKTTLWSRILEEARSGSFTTLSCRPAESEASLSFSALSDLVIEVLDTTLPRLAPTQRRALEVALLHTEESGEGADRRAIAAAFLEILRDLARATPVLVAVDDVQWMDPPSAATVAFALRRLKSERVGVLVTLRTGDRHAEPLGLDRDFGPQSLARITVGPLPQRELSLLIRSRAETPFSRSDAYRLEEASGGNPFLAIELARAAGTRVELMQPGTSLEVPETLQIVVNRRLEPLPEATKEALLLVSALGHPTERVVQRALESGASEQDGLEAAVEAGLLELEGDRIRFTHPLIRSAIYSMSSPAKRRDMHRRLAGVARDTEERARHLALSSTTADAKVAAALDEAARSAHERGAPEAAGELSELAERMTPQDDSQRSGERALRAGRYYKQAGEDRRARNALHRALDRLPEPRSRADALLILGYYDLASGPREAAKDAFLRAKQEAGDDPDLLCDAEQGLAWWSMGTPAALRHARRALELARRGRDPVMLAESLATLAFIESRLGRGIRYDLYEEAMRIQQGQDHSRTIRAPTWILGTLLVWEGDFEACRMSIEPAIDAARARGDFDALPDLLRPLIWAEFRSGNWARAAELAEERWEVASWDSEGGRYPTLLERALMEAYHGKVEAADALLEEAAQGFAALGRPEPPVIPGLKGFMELSQGRAEEAHRFFSTFLNGATGGFVVGAGDSEREPALQTHLPDDVEALVLLGDIEGAEALLRPFERKARSLGRTWASAASDRCRGLLAAASGEIEGALKLLRRSLAGHEQSGEPFEVARTRLVMGGVERRAKRKSAARDSIERALETFESLGAALWSERARDELARVGPRRASEFELTVAERRVAELVSEGSTNREVAAALFVSIKTVEATLRRVYQKLGVRSRTELTRRFVGEPVDASPRET
jgi:DNA-binding CsgD family transcriptional regulator